MIKPNIENKRFFKLSTETLEFVIKDCHEAMAAYPANPKCIHGPGNYADQIHDAHSVIRYRLKGLIKWPNQMGTFYMKDQV